MLLVVLWRTASEFFLISMIVPSKPWKINYLRKFTFYLSSQFFIAYCHLHSFLRHIYNFCKNLSLMLILEDEFFRNFRENFLKTF